MTNKLTILIIEDNAPTQILLSKSLTKLGYNIIIANNGQEGIEYYQQHMPDMILTDIDMPVMDGLKAIMTIRSLAQDFWVPILILSASNQDKDIISGLEAGADDYLPKPINLAILHAKLNAMQRFVLLQRDNTSNALELQRAHNELEQEQLLAKQLADTMLDIGNIDNTPVDYWLCPNSHFSGDFIAASQQVNDTLYVMLADSTGHGLAAALPTMIIVRTFHATTKRGLGLAYVVSEMNSATKSLLPASRFVASNVFAINFRHKTIESWCGGLPDSLILNQQGELVHTLHSEHLALGILPSQSFDASTTLWLWDDPIELLAYTDGLTEAFSPEGETFGEQALLDIIQKAPVSQRLSSLKQAVLDHLQADSGHDDISLLSVQCE